MKLRTKIALLVAAGNLVLSALVATMASVAVTAMLRRELEERGVTMARGATVEIASAIVTDNPLAVMRHLGNFMEVIPDTRYAYVIGLDGEVLAHTFGRGFPADLVEINIVPAGLMVATRPLKLAGDNVTDIGCRVVEGSRAEVHLGLSEAGIYAKVARLRLTICLVTGLMLAAGVTAALVMVQRFSSPLERLAAAARDFGDTGSYRELSAASADEVGQMTRAFNRMALSLSENHARLEASERRFRTLVETAREGLVTLDARSLITFVNRRMLDMSGYAADEVMGRPALDFIAPEAAKSLARQIRLSLEGRSTREETTIVRKDGSRLHTIVASTPLRDEHGGISGVFGLLTDISDRLKTETALKEAKEEMERQNEQLRILDRMKDNLVRDVTHELKTPVARQAMQLEMLQSILDGRGQTTAVPDIIRAMERNLKRQQDVIRNILNLSRLEDGDRAYRSEPLHLDRLVENVLADYRQELDNLEAVTLRDMEEAVVASDGEMLWHVFSNIISNAIKFRRRDAVLTISVSLRRDGGRAVVAIADNGIGVAAADKDKVFNRFFQVSASVEGSGVGLTIAKRIIQELGGTISLESAGLNEGTTVYVTVPDEGSVGRTG